MLLNNRIRILLAIALIVLLPVTKTRGTINSIVLTPGNPTMLSNGMSYYLAGITYNFTVQIIDPDISGWGNITDVSLTIANPNLGAIGAAPYIPVTNQLRLSLVPATGPGNYTPAISAAGQVDDSAAFANVAGTYNNFTVTFSIKFLWSATACDFSAKNITAYARTNLPADNYSSNQRTVSYGVCSSIKVINFSQSGGVTTDAADGYVTPWHRSFNVTGTVVYDVSGASIADKVNSFFPIPTPEILSATLLLDGGSAYRGAAWHTIADDDLSFTVPAWGGVGDELGVGAHNWTVESTMRTAGAVEPSANSLGLFCDRIQISYPILPVFTFINGGGVNSPYYRSVFVPGTQIHIIATRETGGNVIGNTTVTISDGTNTFPVLIANGTSDGIVNVTYPLIAQTPIGRTMPISYQAVSISGGAFDNEQNVFGRITQPASPVIYWDRNDPPGRNGPGPNYDGNGPGVGQTPFSDELLFSTSVTATSFTLNWQPVTALPDPPYDGDFFTYRIYYRVTGPPVNPWIIVDRNTPNYGPTQTYALSNPARTTATITGLIPLTQYDYFMTAVDVFGQEVEHPIPSLNVSDALYDGAPSALGYGLITTNPTQIEASVTDGITNYSFAQFSGSITASTRPLRKSSLQVTIYIVSATDQPDSVNIILGQDDGAGNGMPAVNILGGTFERIPCSKSAPNTWQGFIPSTDQFLSEGSYCRFIIESIRSGTPTYSDIDSVTDSNPDDFEYTFMVNTPTHFTPWPTRILNNVITSSNPICYPSYYLSSDAYVTLTVYDIKGRPVVTILDRGFRKGGQNIKEGGWSGINKARKKLGAGLYYMHFKAKRASDGTTILNETEKVVIAK